MRLPSQSVKYTTTLNIFLYRFEPYGIVALCYLFRMNMYICRPKRQSSAPNLVAPLAKGLLAKTKKGLNGLPTKSITGTLSPTKERRV
jgi:hypothetical protein